MEGAKTEVEEEEKGERVPLLGRAPIENCPAKDHYSLVMMLFAVQGCGCLLPLNAYFNCPDYFLAMYFESIMTVVSAVFLVPNLLGLLVMTFVGDRLPFFVPYVFFALSLILVPMLGFFGVSQIPSLVWTLILLFFSGVFTAILEGAVFGKAYLFPGDEMAHGVMFGCGVVGFLVSLLRILTKVTIERKGSLKKYLDSASIYFFIGSGCMVICMLSFAIVRLLPYSRQFLGLGANDPAKSPAVEVRVGGAVGGGGGAFKRRVGRSVRETLDALRINYSHCGQIFCVFFVSLSIFPGISSVIPTSFPNTFMSDWFGVIMATTFTFFDFVGRTLPRYLKIGSGGWLWVVVASRFIFIVLFVVCLRPPWWLHHDAIPVCLMICMALSSGYFGTSTMMDAATAVHQKKPELSERAGSLMTFFMVLGIATGSLFSVMLFYSVEAIRS